ncbi:tripartite tricarboxylate transporter TctB family protein [Roseinatronobacter sp.]|uniref:tripartite tricarboxylate transporter TctB family protein n=1 Tax=Roseinatronobacter sp. TaxID=1945755 RepID=UPI0025DE6CAE|nr:tripartite tricarboxylate transporter TctB family protein [Roseibaca sp.]
MQDARSVARRVPSGIILFTIAMTAFALMRTFILPPASERNAESAPRIERDVLIKRMLFVMLCFGYFFAFSWLGFNLANLLFLVCAYVLAGMKFLGAGVAAICSSVVFYFLARVMDFNVPIGPFGF